MYIWRYSAKRLVPVHLFILLVISSSSNSITSVACGPRTFVVMVGDVQKLELFPFSSVVRSCSPSGGDEDCSCSHFLLSHLLRFSWPRWCWAAANDKCVICGVFLNTLDVKCLRDLRKFLPLKQYRKKFTAKLVLNSIFAHGWRALRNSLPSKVPVADFSKN